MKNSGVEWLGEVPAHWEVRRLRVIVQIINGATPKSNKPTYWGGDIVWLTPEDLGQLKNRWIETSARRITNEGYKSCGTTIAPTGSIAISTRAPIGHIGVLNTPACVNQGCRLLVPTQIIHPDYLYYELKVAQLDLMSLGQGSTFTELSKTKLGGFALALPPLPEQTAIVRYLGYFDRRIQRYGRAKQGLIKLLEEQKKAVIHRAVTRGLDPDVPLKSSSVEWLGDVPAHWEVVPNRALFNEVKDRYCPNEQMLSVTIKKGIIKQSSLLERFLQERWFES